MKLDFSDVKENKIASEGEHNLVIFGAKEALSQNGTHMLVLDMNDEDEGFVRDNVCLEGAGAFRAKQLMSALAVSQEDFENMQPSDLIGCEISAEIVSEEYNGQLRAKIKKYLA